MTFLDVYFLVMAWRKYWYIHITQIMNDSFHDMDSYSNISHQSISPNPGLKLFCHSLSRVFIATAAKVCLYTYMAVLIYRTQEGFLEACLLRGIQRKYCTKILWVSSPSWFLKRKIRKEAILWPLLGPYFWGGTRWGRVGWPVMILCHEISWLIVPEMQSPMVWSQWMDQQQAGAFFGFSSCGFWW